MTTTVPEPVSTAELQLLMLAAARAVDASTRAGSAGRDAADRAVMCWLLPTALAVAAYDVALLVRGLVA